MPQKTFFNLSVDRRRKILNICFEEFALNDYASASLSSIITRLNLAKGSFYRYFENKLDLYLYLREFSDSLVEEKFRTHLTGKGEDFFQDWGNFFLSLGEIEKEYPMVIRFRLKAAFEQDSALNGRQNQNNITDKTKVLGAVISKYQETGSLRGDIDLDFFSQLLIFANFALSEHIDLKYKIPQTSSVYAVDSKILSREINSMIEILKTGAGSR